MEGWLHVQPPEKRNIIGRAGWKLRYIRFTNLSRITVPGSSTIRQDIASGGGGGGGEQSGRPALERRLVHHGSIKEVPQGWSLEVYKQKGKQIDTEPINRYPISRIASCYIGDVAASKKKSLVQPTLVVNLRGAEIQPPNLSSRSFRRRSQEAPSRDGKKEAPAGIVSHMRTMLFRPPMEDPGVLERWAREIQTHLLPTPSIRSGHEGTVAFSERTYAEGDYEPSTPSPSSLFLTMNGEPSSALLSPSIRSRNSDTSGIDADDLISVMSSSPSEMIVGSPRTDDLYYHRRPQSAVSDARPPLHRRTSSSRMSSRMSSRKGSDEVYSYLPQPPQLPSRPAPPQPAVPTATAGRRETILDRFFSTTTTSSPALVGETSTKHMSSMARFEALMNELESTRDGKSILEHRRAPLLPPSSPNRPRRIPSPTQRALEFVGSGRRAESPGRTLTIDTQASSTDTDGEDVLSPVYTPATTHFQDPFSPLSRKDEDNSDAISVNTLHTTLTNSTDNAGSQLAAAPTLLGPTTTSQGKRHSLSITEFQRNKLQLGSPGFVVGGGGGSRRGSSGDAERGLPPILVEDESGGIVGVEERTTPGMRQSGKELFKEFSF